MISAIDVSYAYPDGLPVISGMNLNIERGQVTGIIGPNGSGKSTLLRLLAGVAKPGEGSVVIHRSTTSDSESGKTTIRYDALHSLAPRRRAKRVAYLPQSVTPLFGLTVFDAVALGRFPHASGIGGLTRHDISQVEMSMEMARVTALRERLFTELSGGERQRVLLASVLAQEPEFLLLDEPTASLDLHHESEVFSLLRDLAALGYGVCLVTHDLSLAAAYCDNLLLLGAGGTPVAKGLPPDVLTVEALSQAYGAPVRVGMHPFNGAPFPYAPPRDAE